MFIAGSLNNDSPGIAEAWVVREDFEGYDILELEALINSSEFARFRGISGASVFWESNSSAGWQSDYTAKINLIADGKTRNYSVILPCRGTSLKGIKLDKFDFPVESTLHGIRVDYPPIQ